MKPKPARHWQMKQAIEHGLHIQLWALPAESISADETDPSAALGLRARLAATIHREGVRL
ncbi:MAG TPA: hypothetical protein VII49_11955 [Rhizomicrobium sp.]